jgi:hypothetical protein
MVGLGSGCGALTLEFGFVNKQTNKQTKINKCGALKGRCGVGSGELRAGG